MSAFAVDLRAAERGDVADRRADDQAGDREPPAREHGPRVAAEVDLLLRVGSGRDGRVRRGSSSGADSTRGPFPLSPQAVLERRSRRPAELARGSGSCRPSCALTSPARGRMRSTSSVRPAIRSSSAIASSTVASSPPPTL